MPLLYLNKTLTMKKLIYLLLTIIIPVAVSAQDAGSILKKTIQAYGGSAWDTVNYIRMHYFGHQNWLEQSENPQGPFIVSYFDTEEIRSSRDKKLYQKTETKMMQSPKPSTRVDVLVDTVGYMAFGERKFPMNYSFREENNRWLQYAPEYLLQQARSSNAKLDKMLELEGVSHYQLSFTKDKIGYTLFINASTFLISEVHIDTYSPNEFFFSLWGKFTTRIQYTLYGLHKHNIVYPLQWDIYRTGQLWKEVTINDIEFLKTVDETPFTISEDIRKAQTPKQNVNSTKLPVDNVIEVAKGIFVIPGNWFTGWVEQEDGIVVIEAPISSGYSVQLLTEVKKRYPAKKIKGVVVTSDAWPHLAGVREYFSENIPVYTSKLNKPMLDRIAAVDHSPLPDHQQIKKGKPDYRLVDNVVSLNDKNSPMQIIPVNGEGGERMVFVYFPNQKVLYASDLVQRGRDGSFFFLEYISEVKAVVDRYKLNVETVYAMHTTPIPFKEIEAALDKNK
jgi:hypothetical protein